MRGDKKIQSVSRPQRMERRAFGVERPCDADDLKKGRSGWMALLWYPPFDRDLFRVVFSRLSEALLGFNPPKNGARISKSVVFG